MKPIFLYCLVFTILLGCKKQEVEGPSVDIYLLKSFTTSIDRTTNPATLIITNAELEEKPLVADEDILFYTKATTTFTLLKDIQTNIQHYGSDKGFAVTVDSMPIYFGRFHSIYSSSITIGVATITSFLFNNNKLQIDFPSIEGSADLQRLDKRNDPRILNAFKATGRLR